MTRIVFVCEAKAFLKGYMSPQRMANYDLAARGLQRHQGLTLRSVLKLGEVLAGWNVQLNASVKWLQG